jgi:aerobic-type carbon monoxide dehydrogenase small subunit (CoxS/CutS family)
MKLTVNGQERVLEGVDPTMPLLWAIRDLLGLKGTKFGCGQALCGACTVHMDGQPVRSCQTSLADVGDSKVTHHRGNSRARCGGCQVGVDQEQRASVRLLPVRADHVSGRIARVQSEALAGRRQLRDERKPLSMRHVSANSRRDRRRLEFSRITVSARR